MFRRLIITACFILTACGVTPTPAIGDFEDPPATKDSSQTGTDEVVWDSPYDPAPELCPEDGVAEGQPLFTAATKEVWNGQEVLVQRGLYVNSQNEIFRIDVMGIDETVVGEYAGSLLVCFDYLPVEIATPDYQEPESSGDPSQLFATPQDLSIEVHMLGYYDPGAGYDEVYANVKAVSESPVSEWKAKFDETGLIMLSAENDFVIHYIVDPFVSSGGRHQYPEKFTKSVYVTVSVSGGSGSVTAGICRNNVLLNGTVMTVAKSMAGIRETDSRSDSQASNYTYDLGVRGMSPSGGRYRISGVWWMPGWSAGYWDAVPPGSTRSCNP